MPLAAAVLVALVTVTKNNRPAATAVAAVATAKTNIA